MEFPEQERFTIDDLIERWGKTTAYLIGIAEKLEFHAQLWGSFVATYPDLSKAGGFWRERHYPHTIDMQLKTNEVLELLKHKKGELSVTKIIRKGQLDNQQIHWTTLGGNGTILITISDLYIPIESILAIEKRSVHRLVIDRLAAHLDNNDGITKKRFGELVHKEYPVISETVGQSLFTFLDATL